MTVEEIMHQVRVLSLEQKKRLISEIVNVIGRRAQVAPAFQQG